MDLKLRALFEHKSQINNMQATEKRIKKRASAFGEKAGVKFAEAFVRLKLPE